MIRVDHTRSRPTLGCGSSASIVRTSRTIMPCRSTSWIAGAYLRRSSAVHAIRVVPARSGRQIGADRRGASQKGMQISMLAFEQALKLRDNRNVGDFRRWKEHDAYQKAL